MPQHGESWPASSRWTFVTATTDTGYTYYGDKSLCKIDHFLIPKTAAGMVRQHTTLMTAMRAVPIYPRCKAEASRTNVAEDA